jgi:hypothetical protein
MYRGALLIALLFATSCKKDRPAGDLPPAMDRQPDKPAAMEPATPPANPHADMDPGGGGGGDPQMITAEPTTPKSLDKLPDGRLALGPFSLAAPADWTVKPITSNMRAAAFQLPAKDGAEAELVVFYFGTNGAGSVDDNLDRWLGQFEQPDGKKSRDVAKIEHTNFGGQDATYVSVSGRFVTQGMPGGGGPVDKPNQSLLAAIVESPSGPYYFKLTGAKSTIDANAAAFRAMLVSLKVR